MRQMQKAILSSSLHIVKGLNPGVISRGSQWGGGIYGYRLKSWLFYGYRLIFFQLRLTKELKINCFSCKKLNINEPVFFCIFKSK